MEIEEVVQENISGCASLDLGVNWPVGVAESVVDGAKVVVQGVSLLHLFFRDLDDRRGCIGF